MAKSRKSGFQNVNGPLKVFSTGGLTFPKADHPDHSKMSSALLSNVLQLGVVYTVFMSGSAGELSLYLRIVIPPPTPKKA
jgi:hypothetical protein